jgi:putative FmdB family regulatory protein
MPTYRYKCEECGYEDFRFNWIRNRKKTELCPCGGRMKNIFHGASLVEVWKPLVLEHIADVPMKFDSKKKLQRYCREKGLTSGALL